MNQRLRRLRSGELEATRGGQTKTKARPPAQAAAAAAPVITYPTTVDGQPGELVCNAPADYVVSGMNAYNLFPTKPEGGEARICWFRKQSQ